MYLDFSHYYAHLRRMSVEIASFVDIGAICPRQELETRTTVAQLLMANNG